MIQPTCVLEVKATASTEGNLEYSMGIAYISLGSISSNLAGNACYNIIIILSNHRNTGPKRGIEPHDEDTRLTHTDTTGLRPDPSPPLRHSATR